MAQRKPVRGPRSSVLWLAIILILVLAIALAAVVFVIGPERQLAVQATVTAQAQASEVQRAYDAGVAFATAGDWDKAAEEFAKVVALEPSYKDAATRLAEVKAKQQEVLATTEAKATQATAIAQAQAEATAAAVTTEARVAQATSVAATVTAQARATVQAQEAKATATADALAELEAVYQKCLGAINLGRWAEAKATCDQVFTVDPNYQDVQVKLAEIEAGLAEIRALAPTVTPVPAETPTPKPTATPIPPAQTPQIINVALKKPATASLTYKQDTPNKVNDGDLETAWNAGTYGPQWWEVEVDGATVTRIRLVVHYGATRVEESKYEVRVYYQPDEAVLKEFSKVTKDGDIFTWTLQQAVSDVQKVRVITWSSPSWVAWDEVEIYGYYP